MGYTALLVCLCCCNPIQDDGSWSCDGCSYAVSPINSFLWAVRAISSKNDATLYARRRHSHLRGYCHSGLSDCELYPLRNNPPKKTILDPPLFITSTNGSDTRRSTSEADMRRFWHIPRRSVFPAATRVRSPDDVRIAAGPDPKGTMAGRVRAGRARAGRARAARGSAWTYQCERRC